ncbi:hypothetical protein AB6A40_002390 [Gnathostoma spinigerum]|uniref:PABC domain-containing protein n=1 Tax=Gnathostoma spinigerum TaxID=75299 RepID=A0ABD6E7T3_9BILA
MNGKMMCTKPLYVALAQRKEDRKAQLASQYMQRLASIRMHSTGAMPGTMYTPGNGGFFVSQALQNQRTTAFMPTAAIPGAQMRGSAPRWNAMGAATSFGVQSPYMVQSGGYGQAGRGAVRATPGSTGIRAQPGQFAAAFQGGGARVGNQAQRLGGSVAQGQQGVRQQVGGRQGQIGKGGLTPQMMYPPPSGTAKAGQAPPHQNGIIVQGHDPLTPHMLAQAPPQEQKQMLGERIYPLIDRICQGPDVGKITGMLLEMDNSELLMMLENEELLQSKVQEAVAVLGASRLEAR